MYSEAESQESYIDCLSSESDSSYQCPTCFSKLNQQRKEVPSKKPSSVKEKIKLFSGSSPLSSQMSLQLSFTESEEDTNISKKKNPWDIDSKSKKVVCKTTKSEPATKILNKKNPWELDPKIYKSRTEICKTANGNFI